MKLEAVNLTTCGMEADEVYTVMMRLGREYRGRKKRYIRVSAPKLLRVLKKWGIREVEFLKNVIKSKRYGIGFPKEERKAIVVLSYAE